MAITLPMQQPIHRPVKNLHIAEPVHRIDQLTCRAALPNVIRDPSTSVAASNHDPPADPSNRPEKHQSPGGDLRIEVDVAAGSSLPRVIPLDQIPGVISEF
jgi:hypothetical protein